MTTHLPAHVKADRWVLVILAVSAGFAALAIDVPSAAVFAIAPAAALAMLYLLEHPGAWVVWFLALGLLLPALPLEIGSVELPLHPAMLVLAAGCIVIWVRLPEWHIEFTPLTTASILLLGALLLSLPWAFYYSGPAVGAQSAMRWALLLSGFLVMGWVAYGPTQPRGLLQMILAAALIASVFAVLDFVFQLPRTVRFSDQYIYGSSNPIRRAQGVFYDASALGNFCAMMLTLMLALGRRARQALQVPAWLLWISAPTLALALVLSFSRGSVLNLAVAVTVLAWMRRRTLFSARGIVAAVVLVFAAGVVAALIAPQYLLPYGNRLVYTAQEFFANPNEVLSKRVDTWTELASFVAEHPWQIVLGIGYKSLPYTDTFARPLVADNMYLSVLIESGLPGLGALLVFCGAVLVTTLRMARRADYAVAGLGRFLFAFWIGEMVQMLSGDILTFWRVTPVYLALLGLALRK
jgi:O-antigen ligase